MSRLKGMKAIADHMGRHPDTIDNWRRTREFPVVQVGGTWEADVEDIERWRRMPIGANASMSMEQRIISLERRMLEIEDRESRSAVESKLPLEEAFRKEVLPKNSGKVGKRQAGG